MPKRAKMKQTGRKGRNVDNKEQVAEARRSGVALQMAAAALRNAHSLGDAQMAVLAVAEQWLSRPEQADDPFAKDSLMASLGLMLAPSMVAVMGVTGMDELETAADELDSLGSLVAGGHPAAMAKIFDRLEG